MWVAVIWIRTMRSLSTRRALSPPPSLRTDAPLFLSSSSSSSFAVSCLHQQLCHGWTLTWEGKSVWGCSGDNRISELPLDELFVNASLPNSFLTTFQLSTVWMSQSGSPGEVHTLFPDTHTHTSMFVNTHWLGSLEWQHLHYIVKSQESYKTAGKHRRWSIVIKTHQSYCHSSAPIPLVTFTNPVKVLFVACLTKTGSIS